MQEQLKLLFIQICQALGMQQRDPLMYAYVNDRIDQLQKDFNETLDAILRDEPYIAPNKDTKKDWSNCIQIQAVHIFSELLRAITASKGLKKHVTIKYGSERYAAIQEHIKDLSLYANTIKSKYGKISVLDIDKIIENYKLEDQNLRNDSNFRSAINSIFKHNVFSTNKAIRVASTNLGIASILKFAKTDLDKAELFLMSASTETICGYSSELENWIIKIMKSNTCRAIDPEHIKIFFQTIKKRLSLERKISNANAIIQLMKILDITQLNDLVLLTHRKNAVLKRFIDTTNTRPRLNESELEDLISEPILLFNVLMKLSLDNLLENLTSEALEKDFKDRYYSGKGLVFPQQKLYSIYASVLKTLDYKLHVNDEQFTAIKSGTYPLHPPIVAKNNNLRFTSKLSVEQIDTLEIYKQALKNLADYTDFLEKTASNTHISDLRIKNRYMTAYINELNDIHTQLNSVTIPENYKVTKSMCSTLVKFTERVITISHQVREELNGTAQRFDKQNASFLERVLMTLSSLCEKLMCAFYRVIYGKASESIVTPEGETKRQQVTRKVLKNTLLVV